MNQIVAYQLERAVVRSSGLIKNAIAVKPVVQKLVDAMNKVYADKQVVISTDLADHDFFGDERDLMELLGNLIDNACKYGDGKVLLKVRRDEPAQCLHV